MRSNRFGSSSPSGEANSKSTMERIISEARKAQAEREKGYREQSLKIHPWICARCGREFTSKTLHMLTVHHKDHNHDHNPPDGSNWENLCLYCHDNEHSRYKDHIAGRGTEAGDHDHGSTTYKPFANLKDLLEGKK